MFLQRISSCVLLAVGMAGCSSISTHSTGEDVAVSGTDPTQVACPQEIQEQVKITAAAAAARVSARAKDDGLLLSRSVIIAVSPTPRVAKQQLLANQLTVTAIGGTFAGVVAPTPGTLTNETAAAPHVREMSDTRAIDVIPGRLQISPFVTSATLHPQTVSLDLLVNPGAVPLDEMVVSAVAMWDAQRKPLSADRAAVALAPLRHVSVYDQMEGLLAFHWVVANRLHQQWECSTETRFTLVDRAATAPSLWDLRVGPQGHSELWLALSTAKTGPFRAIFATPADASSFADWLHATHATQIAGYDVGLFRPGYSRDELRTLPEPHALADTFRTATADDLDALLVGRLGEP
jgi:hypothetical protein